MNYKTERNNFITTIIEATGCSEEQAEKFVEKIKECPPEISSVIMKYIPYLDLKNYEITGLKRLIVNNKVSYLISAKNIVEKDIVEVYQEYYIYPEEDEKKLLNPDYIKENTGCTEKQANYLYQQIKVEDTYIRQIFVDEIKQLSLANKDIIYVDKEKNNISIIVIENTLDKDIITKYKIDIVLHRITQKSEILDVD